MGKRQALTHGSLVLTHRLIIIVNFGWKDRKVVQIAEAEQFFLCSSFLARKQRRGRRKGRDL